jgi:hypothetical protein
VILLDMVLPVAKVTVPPVTVRVSALEAPSVPVYPVMVREAAAAAAVMVIFPDEELSVAVSPATGVPKAAAQVPWSADTEVQTLDDQLPPDVQAYQTVAWATQGIKNNNIVRNIFLN